MKTKKLYIVDLDGVMNSKILRKGLMPKTDEEKATSFGWLKWHEAHEDEVMNSRMIEFLNHEWDLGATVLFLSMRLDVFRESTVHVLTKAGLKFNPWLWLCKTDDDTPPAEMRARDVHRALQLMCALGLRAHITLIDDSLDNVRAVQECPLIKRDAKDFGCEVFTVLYPVYKGE